MWKQKIYKSLFSILLTGICVTAVTYAASVSYIKDGEVLTEQYMSTLVTAINSKANLSEVYTKAQVDAKIPNCWEGEFITANGKTFSCVGAPVDVTPPKDPTNGSCGNSQNKSFTSRPTTGLCNSGSLVWADNTGTDGTYNWQCLWNDGGSNASCSAKKFECSPQSFQVYNWAGTYTYKTSYGNIGDTEMKSWIKNCNFTRRGEVSKPWEQTVDYTFTCTSSGWVQQEVTGPCRDSSV